MRYIGNSLIIQALTIFFITFNTHILNIYILHTYYKVFYSCKLNVNVSSISFLFDKQIFFRKTQPDRPGGIGKSFEVRSKWRQIEGGAEDQQELACVG